MLKGLLASGRRTGASSRSCRQRSSNGTQRSLPTDGGWPTNRMNRGSWRYKFDHSRREQRPIAGVQGRWHPTALGEERRGTLLHCAVRRVHDRADRTGSTWNAGPPAKLFDWPIPPSVSRSHDVSADGLRFLTLKPVEGLDDAAEPASLVVVQHFDEEPKRLVPVK